MMGISRRGLVAGTLAAPFVFGTSARAQAAKIRIGVPMELSGRFVAYGASGKRGSEFAAEMYGGSVAGKEIELLVRDIQSESQATISVFNELVLKERVNYIVGPIASPTVAAAIPTWKQAKPIWLVPGSTSTKLEDEAGKEPEFFHTFPYAYHYHESIAATLKEQVGPGKSVAIIYSDDNYGRTHLPHARKYLTEAGFTIAVEEIIRTNAPDMNPILTKIIRSKPDILLGLLQTTDSVTLAKQIHTRRLPVPYLVGTAATQLDEWQKAVGEAQEGWLGVTTFLPGLKRAANPEFPKLFPSLPEWEALFHKKYGQEPDFEDAGCYASMAVLLIAIERAGGDDKAKVMEELGKLDLQTILGRARFAPTPSGTKHQAFTDMLVFQRQKNANTILFPKDVANGRIVAVTR